MISEKQLAQHASFWSVIAPMMEPFIKSINQEALCGSGFGFTTVPSIAPPSFRAIVNQCSFHLARRRSVAVPDKSVLRKIVRQAYIDLSFLESTITLSESLEVADFAREEIQAMAENIKIVCTLIGGKVSFSPSFPGCGYVSQCVGDLIVGDCIAELKAGKRSFRIEDLRQCLVYAMLDFASSESPCARIALANPREGILARFPLSLVTRRIASVHPAEFFSRFMFHVSGGGISR